MPRRFIGRHTQLAALQRFYRSPEGHLATVRGRRRVGKSTLLLRSLEAGKSAYHQAAELTPEANYQRFREDILEALRPLLTPGTASDLEHAASWRAMILALGHAATELGRLTVVIDEFPYLTRSDATLESVVQEALGRIETLEQPLKLVLCGSAISQMEALLQHSSPLHGRSELNLNLPPLDYRESALFTPAWSPEDLVRTRTLFGGMPRYLAALDDTRSLAENYEQLVLAPDGPLHGEIDQLLKAELTEPRVYASIMMAMSRGRTRAGEITDTAGVKPTSFPKYVERLEELGLTRRLRSVNAAPAARNVRYQLADPFVSSWYRYVLPNLSSLRARGGDGGWQRIVAPTLDTDPSAAPGTFEDICRHWTALHVAAIWDGELGEVGQILQGRGQPDAEINVACPIGRGQQASWVLGECKWQTRPQGASSLRQLQDNAEALLGAVPVHRWLVFSRTGFSPVFAASPGEGVDLIDLPTLYRPN